MRLCRWSARAQAGADTGGDTVVLIFGLGVVGQSIDGALRRLTLAGGITLPFSWTDAEQRREDFARIADRLGRGAGPPPVRIAVVWAAGRSSFQATSEDMQRETALLDEVLAFAARLAETCQGAEVSFHMISSAGGLFEGIAPCGATTLPRPLRPYGEGKLIQEDRVRAAGLPFAAIYRLSSVYGFVPGGRMGLIPALLSNALRFRWTHIFGGPATLRDYVRAEDIGHFVAGRILSAGRAGVDTFLLASGRSVSMYEVIAMVDQIVPTPILLQFDPRPSNARDMRFLPSALPAGWVTTPLQTGVVQLANRLRQRPV